MAERKVTQIEDAAGNLYDVKDTEARGEIESINEALENKAEIDGYYETMTVGDAEQLISTVFTEDKGVYNFRTAGGNADIGNREDETVVGGTIGWNQLIPAANKSFQNSEQDSKTALYMVLRYNASPYTASVTKSIDTVGKYEIVFSAQASGGSLIIHSGSQRNFTLASGFSLILGHKYLLCIDCLGVNPTAVNGISTDNQQLFDLTAMFGSTIADYIYGLEQANAGAGVAWFRKLFPKPYYAYNAGELMSVKAASHDMTGFNQWDEEWEVGGFNADGTLYLRTDCIRSKNYIPIVPGQAYHIKQGTVADSNWSYWVFYDAGKNIIDGRVTVYGTVTAPSNACYAKFQCNTAYGATYNNDICINLSWSGYRNGEYEPYELHSVKLDDSLELRGIPKLDESGNLSYDGDVYESSGEVTRKYGIVDLGTLTWTYDSAVPRFVSSGLASVIKTPIDNNTAVDGLMCGIYQPYSANGLIADVKNMHIAVATSANISVVNTSYTTPETFTTAMSGVYLVYELATPVTEEADGYANPQWVNDFGTEEYVDAGVVAGTRDVAIPVGHETKYVANLRDKLQHLPATADEDGDYAIRQTANQMHLVPLDDITVKQAKSAKQLESSAFNEDAVPYNFRTAGGSADIGDLKYESIVGGTVCWNQLVNKDKFVSGTASELSWTPNGDGTITLTVSSTMAESKSAILTANAGSSYFKLPQGHKGIIYDPNVSSWPTGAFYRDSFRGVAMGNNTIYANSLANGILLTIVVPANTTAQTFKAAPQIFDLTAMFGSTIADYVYSLETATAGAGVAWFRKLFPKPYYAYNAGELMSVRAAAMETVGFNQWDEEWESGVYDANGNKTNNNDYIRSTNHIPVLPSTIYYFKAPSMAGRVCFYDANKVFISRSDPFGNATFTTPSNCAFITFFTSKTDFRDGSVCLNLSWSGYRNGEYEPYEKNTYELDNSLELRGIPKLNASNDLYFDGDTYESDGTVTRRYGVVDLGTLSWSTGDDNMFFTGGLNIVKSNYGNSIKAPMICDKYQTVAYYAGPGFMEGTDKSIAFAFAAGQRLYVRDTSYSNAAALQTALSGVYLVYELETPTTETAAPYTNPQQVDDFGTERIVDAGVEAEERDVEIPVGHSTKYLLNLRDKLQHLPDLANGNGVYVISQSNNEMHLTPLITPTELPTAPSENGTYSLKVTVANGVPTYSWVSD